ncbi:glycoside hydrolase family 3 protein [Moniliophthora roreri MCA 2997]|uniref:beta-glucosidase n=1 Tax=Moniliophthora roreri (strain MCA 2997) TaxID=1381753 RepID=V2YI03_MONRO|nr:glycoside hydrolase family 3 protein [Moniliophthora roreri MCA 2997]
MPIRLSSWLILFVCLYSPATYGFTTRSWDESYALANQTVALMTLDEKIEMVTGVGIFSSRCVGNIKPPSRSFSVAGTNVAIPPICFSDGPAGMRLVKQVTGFPSGINVASTFSKRLMRARGVAIGEEFRAKGMLVWPKFGSHVFLGPAMDIVRTSGYYTLF